jgi:hypothetical protein
MATPRMTADLADALPRRPIAVRPPQTVGPLALFGVFALLIGSLAGLLWWLGPNLVRDWRIGDAAVAGDVRIEEARCRSRFFVLQFCNVTLAEDGTATAAKRTLWYVYLGTGGSDRVVVALRSRSDPALLSTDLGQEQLLSRSAALALAVSLLGLCIGATVRIGQQGIHSQRGFRGLSGQRLTPVVVEIERHNFLPPRRRLWVYRYDDGGRQGRAFIELPSRDRPLFTDAAEKHALALRGAEGGVPLLLDAKLACLDLTEAERAAFFAGCRKALGLPDDPTSA